LPLSQARRVLVVTFNFLAQSFAVSFNSKRRARTRSPREPDDKKATPRVRFVAFCDRVVSIPRTRYLPSRNRGIPVPKQPTTIGGHLRRRRLQLQIHQSEVAVRLKVSTVTLSRWECDKVYPTWEHHPRLIEYLGYDPFVSCGLRDSYGNETPDGKMPAESRCTPREIQNYLGRISGPLLDRIDLHVEVPSLKFRDITSERVGETSAQIRARVIAARERQLARFAHRPRVSCNARMGSKDIKAFCRLDDAGMELVRMAMTEMNLSARAYDRILKVARTIADLAGAEHIDSDHVSEAVQFRSLDRQLWT
jgi:transcriptional regulator with XRE-family HTH domain